MLSKRRLLALSAIASLIMGTLAPVSAATAAPRFSGGFSGVAGDFDGDGNDDIVTFTRGDTGDVYVALSTGDSFEGTGDKWHDSFAYGNEIPLVGDFDGDGKDDIATFTRGNTGDVYVALSTGDSFEGTGDKWDDYFGYGNAIPVVGDFDGDGKDDIAAFTRGNAGDVYVALSTGDSFENSDDPWLTGFAYGDEIPEVGDFDGDGLADVVSFSRGTTGDVYVALSTGSSFEEGATWYENFAFGNELPAVGDFNGDGEADLASFTRGTTGDVYVALSTGSSFHVLARKWHDRFCYGREIPGTGDFNGDGRTDIVTFTRGAAADVYVATAARSRFSGTADKWHDYFAAGNEIPQPGIIF